MNSATSNEKKRHHYVPVTYLNGFADSTDRIFAYLKDQPNDPIHTKPSAIAFENFFYSQPLPEGGQDNNKLEDFFSSIESRWPGIVQKIRGRQDMHLEMDALVKFLTMLRVRVPAVRDSVETMLAEQVKATARVLDGAGLLPPKPPGHEDILDRIAVAIDPHQSIHAMPSLARGFDCVIQHIGFQVLHNETNLDFITTDNPVVVFDPDVTESNMRPYKVQPPQGRIELLFAVDSRTLLRGHSTLRAAFVARGIGYASVDSRDFVRRTNRLIARFGYRFIFASSRAHDPLVRKYAGESPIAETVTFEQCDGRQEIRTTSVFGARPTKTKWTKVTRSSDA